jgi:flagellar protein FliO/FliZ
MGSAVHSSDWLSFAASFAVVLGLLGLLLYTLKKMQSGSLLGLGQRRIRVLESMSVGPRQKIVLLRVKDQDILVGVTVQQMTTLASFTLSDEERVAAEASPAPATVDAASPMAQRFAELIKSASNSIHKGKN